MSTMKNVRRPLKGKGRPQEKKRIAVASLTHLFLKNRNLTNEFLLEACPLIYGS